MNDLLSRTSENDGGDLEMGIMGEAERSLNDFLGDANRIQQEIEKIKAVLQQLRSCHEQSKVAHRASVIQELRKRMEQDISLVLRTVKALKQRLDALDKSNSESRLIPGCQAGSSSDRTRMATTNGLRSSLQKLMVEFQALREDIKTEYHETVKRRYFTVTGEAADEETVERMIESGESERIFEKAIQQQGRSRVMDVIGEIQERYDAVQEMERSLKELHQVFLDMAVLVKVQGEQLDDIEAHVGKASSFVESGNRKLHQARKLQLNTRKWTCIGIIVLIIILLIIILPIVLRK